MFLRRMKRAVLVGVVVGSLGSALAERASAQTLQYSPYGAWRGRAVARDGLFRVQRYRWGNGLTPTGGAFLTSAVGEIVPILPTLLPALIGREADSRDSGNARNQGGATLSSRDDYVYELRRANDLLERTQHLLGKAGSPVEPALESSLGEKLKPEEVEKKFGSNPWRQ